MQHLLFNCYKMLSLNASISSLPSATRTSNMSGCEEPWCCTRTNGESHHNGCMTVTFKAATQTTLPNAWKTAPTTVPDSVFLPFNDVSFFTRGVCNDSIGAATAGHMVQLGLIGERYFSDWATSLVRIQIWTAEIEAPNSPPCYPAPERGASIKMPLWNSPQSMLTILFH